MVAEGGLLLLSSEPFSTDRAMASKLKQKMASPALATPADPIVSFTPRELHLWFELRATLAQVYPSTEKPDDTLIPLLEEDFLANFIPRSRRKERVR